MKPALTGLVFVLFLSTLHAQNSRGISVPVGVMDQFILLYPDAKNIKWQMEEENFKVKFINYKKATMVVLREDGTVFKTETEIKVMALPEAATAYLLDQVKAKKIDAATIIEDEAGIITFEAETSKADYRFDAYGQLLGSDGMFGGTR